MEELDFKRVGPPRKSFTPAAKLTHAEIVAFKAAIFEAEPEGVEYISNLEAENAALKEQVAQLSTVPMKYRRMEFNAQLQKEVTALKETIAQQAEALRVKDEALKEIDLADDDRDFLRGNEVDLVAYALAIQPNPDILRERDARLVERIAASTMDYYPEVDILLGIADQIRKGEF